MSLDIPNSSYRAPTPEEEEAWSAGEPPFLRYVPGDVAEYYRQIHKEYGGPRWSYAGVKHITNDILAVTG